MCDSTLFNAYQICITCGFSVCIDCDIQKKLCCQDENGNHLSVPCVVHSSVSDFQKIIKESEVIAQKYGLQFVDVPRQRKSRLTLAELMKSCPDSELSTHSLQTSMIVLENVDQNEEALRFLLKETVPFLIECQNVVRKEFWSPSSLAQQFGDATGTINYVNKKEKGYTASIRKYFTQFKSRRENDMDLLKLSDWPLADENITMIGTIPQVLKELYDIIPFGRFLSPGGTLNLASYVHWAMHTPDIVPKFFSSDGSLTGTTNLHVDLCGAVNICVHAEPCPDKEKEAQYDFLKQYFPGYDESKVKGCPAAVWHIFLEDSYEDVKR